MCRNVTIMMRHDKQVSKHFMLDHIFMHSAYLWTRWLDAKATTKYCFVNGDNLSHALLAKQSGTRHNVERSYLAMTPLGMVRRGRRRVIEGNERLLLITPCLLSGVHTCFRNILPAVYNQAALCTRKRMLSRVSRLGSWYSHTCPCTGPKVSTKPYAEALARIREREDIVARSAPDRSTSCRSPTMTTPVQMQRRYHHYLFSKLINVLGARSHETTSDPKMTAELIQDGSK